MQLPEFETLLLTLDDHVLTVTLNRPEKMNALNEPMWREILEAFQWADQQSALRVIIVAAEGKHFCSGIDLEMLQSGGGHEDMDPSMRIEAHRRRILWLQSCFTAIENCRIPVITAIHAGCIGGAVDMVTAADIRYATADAIFCVKEVDVGLAADVGTLQRLPRLVPEGVAREWALTARNVDAEEALRYGLISRVFPDREAMMSGVREIAADMASKAPLAMRSTKAVLNYSREHSIEEGLDYEATWNAGMTSQQEVMESVMAKFEKRPAQFKS